MDDIINFKRKEEDDLYFILGCDENSTEDQINAEYKARVLGCHPDKHPNDASAHEQFSKLSKAKDVLLDSEKRKDYDKWRNSGISIPYERWKSMSHIKTSMHWGHRKEQPALTSDQNQPASHHQSPVYSTQHPHATSATTTPPQSSVTTTIATAATPNASSASSSPHIPPMNFVKRERPSVTGWESDTSNPLLKKFRNYEI